MCMLSQKNMKNSSTTNKAKGKENKDCKYRILYCQYRKFKQNVSMWVRCGDLKEGGIVMA